MTKKVCIALLSSLLATSGMMAQPSPKPLILTGPAEYYIQGISPNGVWAYGTYLTGSGEGYAFRWNLQNNKIELLSAGSSTSSPTGISNDGTVAGFRKDNTIVPNGAYVRSGEFWKNGKWNRLPNPITGKDDCYDGDLGLNINCITPDSRFLGGTSMYNDVIVWKNEELDWTSKSGYTCSASCISPDGQMLGGWSFDPTGEEQRLPILWRKGQDPIWLKHQPICSSSVFNTCYQFSNNGKWLLYWGGYNETGDDPNKATLYGLYNLEKGETVEIPCMTDRVKNMRYFSINSNGTCLGKETGSTFSGKTDANGNPEFSVVDSTYLTIYKDGKVQKLPEYLESKGVDFKSNKNFKFFDADGGTCISDDERILSLRYADTLGYIHSMIIMLDQNMTSRPPVQVEAQRITGSNGILVTWKEPLANADDVKSYNVYRNGTLVANVPAGTFRYVDDAVQIGSQYSYTVTSVYPETESSASDVASIDYNAIQPQAPVNLFAHQVREANVLLEWDAPKSNFTVKNYYDDTDKLTGFGADDLSFEVAINIPADEMVYYKNQKLTSVNFCPMSPQKKWVLNVYTKDTSTGELTQVYTQPITQQLNYGRFNSVVLDTPLSLPEDKNVYVAIAVYPIFNYNGYNLIGEMEGKVKPGYSDLVRLIEFDDPDFYSAYEDARKKASLSANAWAIDAVFTPDGADPDRDKIKTYLVYVDGQQVGQTAERQFESSLLEKGTHTFAVATVYNDGSVSPNAETKLNIVENTEYYQPTQNVYADPNGAQGVTVHWTMPKDKGAAYVSYAYGNFGRALAGMETLNYNYRARAEYAENLFRGYEGYKITALRFYPCAESDYTLILYADKKKVAEVSVDEYTKYEWNDIPLPTPLDVEQGVVYSLEADCYDTETGGTPLCIDDGVMIYGVSNLLSTDDGQSYSTLYDNIGLNGNWMIGLKLENGEERPLNIAGFNVVIDNKKVNTELVQGNSYDYTPARTDARSHRLRVDAVYNVKGEVQGSVVIFTFSAGGPEGINDATVAQISVDRNGSQIQVSGADVKDVTLVGMDGKAVAHAVGNSLDVTHVQAGSYVLSVKLATGELKSQKLMIK